MNIHRLMRILAVITSFCTYLIVLMGALVTTTDSGHGCGNSWPFCHGQIIPGVITVSGIIEYSHRIMSSVDGFFVLVLTIATWLIYKRDARVRIFGFLSLFFLLLQGALGALTVVYEGTLVLPWLLSVHFGLSLIAFASVVLLTVRLFQIKAGPEDKAESALITSRRSMRKVQMFAWGLAIYTYVVVYTGALVEHTGAVVGCGRQIPGCGTTYLPSFTSLAGIQVLHRYAASSVWLLVLALLMMVLLQYRERRDIVHGAWWAFALITLQALSGMTSVITGGQLLVALLHTTVISVFYAVLCYLCVQVGWPWGRKRLVQPVESERLELHSVS